VQRGAVAARDPGQRRHELDTVLVGPHAVIRCGLGRSLHQRMANGEYRNGE
jgi:hypothetical protein